MAQMREPRFWQAVAYRWLRCNSLVWPGAVSCNFGGAFCFGVSTYVLPAPLNQREQDPEQH